MEDIVVLIPTYNPNIKIMRSFIDELTLTFQNIIVVNDGSDEKFNDFFDELKKLNIIVLTHNTNIGKGQAIKTGFEYILNNFPNIAGTITADCDGQHSVSDISKCAIALKENPNSLIVGCRNFKEPQTPFKSKYGNTITIFVFMLFIGIKISDTQSGLRGFSPELMRKFLLVKGKRYEYETNVLIECKNSNIPIYEVPIQTIYINKNETSHFNPVKDSLMIYKLFFKYVLTAVSSFALDILLFCIFINIIKVNYNIMISTVIARILSSIYNFLVNSKFVFKKSNKKSLIKYFILVIIQMLISGVSVTFFSDYLHLNAPVTKLIVDTVIFVVNFIVQREWIFNKE